MGDDDDRILVSYVSPREMYMIVIERLSLQIVATASLERTRMVGLLLGNAMHTARTHGAAAWKLTMNVWMTGGYILKYSR
jgi:hypothetical protein